MIWLLIWVVIGYLMGCVVGEMLEMRADMLNLQKRVTKLQQKNCKRVCKRNSRQIVEVFSDNAVVCQACLLPNATRRLTWQLPSQFDGQETKEIERLPFNTAQGLKAIDRLKQEREKRWYRYQQAWQRANLCDRYQAPTMEGCAEGADRAHMSLCDSCLANLLSSDDQKLMFGMRVTRITGIEVNKAADASQPSRFLSPGNAMESDVAYETWVATDQQLDLDPFADEPDPEQQDQDQYGDYERLRKNALSSSHVHE